MATDAGAARPPKPPWRARLRSTWLEVLGLDEVDEGALLFTHHRRTVRHAFEILLLAALLALCALVPMESAGQTFRYWNSQVDRTTFHGIFLGYIVDIAEPRLPFVIGGWAGVLLLLRILKRPATLAAGLVAWPVAAWTVWLQMKAAPYWAEISAGWPADRMPIPVSKYFLGLPGFAMPVVAIAGGVYAARRGYSHARWFAGSALATVCAYLLLRQNLPSLAQPDVVAGFLLLMLSAFVFVRLPLQRRMLEEAFGFDLTSRDGGAWRRLGFADALGLHALVAGIVLVLLSAFAICELPRAVLRQWQTDRTVHAPELANAHDILGNWFTQDEDAPKYRYIDPIRERDLSLLSFLSKYTPPDEIGRLAETVPANTWETLLATREPRISLLAAASKADYYDPSEGKAGKAPTMNYSAVSGTVRLLPVRALCRARSGDVQGALDDVESAIRIGVLLSEMGHPAFSTWFAPHVVGSGVAGGWMCRDLWLDDPDALAKLAAMLARHERRATVAPDHVGNMERHMAFGRFTFPFEAMMQPIAGMRTRTDEMRGDYRCLRIAVAIDRFHLAHDAWPATIDELVPEFLDEVPREPTFGNLYVLQSTTAGERPAIMRGKQAILTLPGYVQNPGNARLVEEIEKREKKHR